MPGDAFETIDRFVRDTRGALFVRRADNVLLIRPEKTLGVNESAARILETLYDRSSPGARESLSRLARELAVDPDRLVSDASALLETVAALMRDDFALRPNMRLEPFCRGRIRYPILAEIALTYGCQNRCAFCYASSPHRGRSERAMSTDEVRRVMRVIFEEAHVPSLSFTGGEATLRDDLAELVAHGRSLGFRVNLITNGIRLADPDYAGRLVDAGLSSAQVSIEAAGAGLHDSIVGRPGAFDATVAGIRNLVARGVHVHTNTTLMEANLDHVPGLIRFVARDLGRPTMSLNMLIRSGMALGRDAGGVTYTEICRRLPDLVETARSEGIRLVWYSPIPYCLTNPVLLGQGAKACACVDGLLSVSPAGDVLPCSSFDRGIGSLLRDGWAAVRDGKAARYWSEKRFLPPVCDGCPDADLCCGACPLYWDSAGSFSELPREGSSDPEIYARWRAGRAEGGSFGVPPGPAVSAGEVEA